MKLSEVLCDYYWANEHPLQLAPTTAKTASVTASALDTTPSIDTLATQNPNPTEINLTLTLSKFQTQ